jgi:CubicO group peptidase (beta-lactamase class C family)/D-alanyl-D-alanine dipeptidase
MGRVCLIIVALALSIGALGFPQIRSSIEPRRDYAQITQLLESSINRELKEKHIPGIFIALVDDQNVVWARGFGYADPGGRVPATVDRVLRVGSVAELFTVIAIMQLVEQKKLDLDAPVSRYLPDFTPKNPFGGPITIRQLCSHCSGLTREPPVGNYFDDTSPTLAQAVASLNSTTLVYKPGSRLKYTHSDIAVLGYILEKTQREPLRSYLTRAILDPVGLKHSAFEPLPALKKDLAKGLMWSFDGKTSETPTFQLSTCGDMYATVLDLARFEYMLFSGGALPGGRRILKPETLALMFTPQYRTTSDQVLGFGIGFSCNALSRSTSPSDFSRAVGVEGGIYGFSETVSALPAEKLGAVVVANLDGVSPRTGLIAEQALGLMLDQRTHKPLRPPAWTTDLPKGLALRLQGDYASGDQRVELREFEGKLLGTPPQGGFQSEIRQLAQFLVDDSRRSGRVRNLLLDQYDGSALRIGGETFTRVETPKSPEIKPEWRGLIGEYGWDYNTVYILETMGKLTALIEWFSEFPLEQLSPDVYRIRSSGLFPNLGSYDGEEVRFQRDKSGQATEAIVGAVSFKRRPLPSDGEKSSFRITPVRPVEELRKAALAASPPVEQGSFKNVDLIELRSLDSSIRYDIRYATSNNFMGAPFYSSAHAFLQRPAAEAMARAARKLRPLGFGLLIHGAYRPWYVTKMFWDGTPADKHIFVADPAQGSRHNRGCAVDLTLYDLKTGAPVRMTGGYDEMSERSYPNYPGGTSYQRWQRDLLRQSMEAEGFRVYEYEWWHFDYQDWKHYPVLNLTFEQLSRKAGQNR